MKKIILSVVSALCLTHFSHASLPGKNTDDVVVRDPRVQAQTEVFIIDEQEWDVDLHQLTDGELFGEEGLIQQMLEYEATASRNPGKNVRRKALRRSCAAPRNGQASYYAHQFHGRKTASGERFNMNAMTAAHKTIAFGSLVRVTYKGKSVVVRINDAGPYAGGRVIDLSLAAAKALGLVRSGHGHVSLQILRCGKA